MSGKALNDALSMIRTVERIYLCLYKGQKDIDWPEFYDHLLYWTERKEIGHDRYRLLQGYLSRQYGVEWINPI